MICVRCGTCCITMGVTILRKGDAPGFAFKPGDALCPHLSFSDGKACCEVHESTFYPNTPCWVYGNSDVDPDFYFKKGQECRVGKLILQRGGALKGRELLVQTRPKIQQLELIEDLG